MDIMEFFNTHYQWLFSGLGVTVLIGLIGLLKYFLGKKKPAPKVENKNSNQNIGSGNATQIVNQNNYHIENNNLIPQKELSDSIKNDAMLLEYIEHALEKLNNALILLRPSAENVTGNIEGARCCINESVVDNDLNYYLNNSTTLTAQEIIAVKKCFNQINNVIRFINQQATIDTQAELQRGINHVLSDQSLRAVKEKLEKELKI